MLIKRIEEEKHTPFNLERENFDLKGKEKRLMFWLGS
jgi:hypothetical protein